ncbi:hypothetical protein Y032_0890g2889 [Ancylostoma ceylanicum]|nr:hypothetical protein Y032_0890g2889 [Ancylostoma ceylanicum]
MNSVYQAHALSEWLSIGVPHIPLIQSLDGILFLHYLAFMICHRRFLKVWYFRIVLTLLFSTSALFILALSVEFFSAWIAAGPSAHNTVIASDTPLKKALDKYLSRGDEGHSIHLEAISKILDDLSCSMNNDEKPLLRTNLELQGFK